MLIRAYGEFWNPDIVDWGSRGAGNQGRLMGKVKLDDRNYDVDVWRQRGIRLAARRRSIFLLSTRNR